jgi:hypothetical protein
MWTNLGNLASPCFSPIRSAQDLDPARQHSQLSGGPQAGFPSQVTVNVSNGIGPHRIHGRLPRARFLTYLSSPHVVATPGLNRPIPAAPFRLHRTRYTAGQPRGGRFGAPSQMRFLGDGTAECIRGPGQASGNSGTRPWLCANTVCQ